MIRPLYILYSIIYILLATSCHEDDDNGCSGVDCLPPATQTGAGTFGCLVNGEPFVDNSGRFNCFYQLVDGEYYFGITGDFGNRYPRDISLSTNGLQIVEGGTYALLSNETGNFYGSVRFDAPPPTFFNDNTTNDVYSGRVKLDRLDLEANIISGTFYFTIKDTINNNILDITDGRFDSTFTQ